MGKQPILVTSSIPDGGTPRLTIDTIFLSSPQLETFARYLGIRRSQAIGHMVCLWAFADHYSDRRGRIRCASDALASGSDWYGNPDIFAAALIEAGFITYDGDAYRINFWGRT